MFASLIAIGGPLSGATLPLADAAVSIGRDDGNAIMLADPAVSPRHCLIEPEGRGLSFRDLDANNPTFVNGISSGRGSLQDGDRIQVGASVFVVKLGAREDVPIESVRLEQAAPGMSAD